MYIFKKVFVRFILRDIGHIYDVVNKWEKGRGKHKIFQAEVVRIDHKMNEKSKIL